MSLDFYKSLNIKTWLEQHLPFDLNYLPPSSYLVGGIIRDILLKRTKNYLDLDFIIPNNAIEIAYNIARIYHAGYVVLDDKRDIARVVFSDVICDFAQQDGLTIKQDLQRRDFTINSIAYSLKDSLICDPNQGLIDLNNNLIRMISKKNLKDDPLRLLRAYRQASQLNFNIEDMTRNALKELSWTLKTTAGERVKSEINYILSSSSGSYWLKLAYEDQIFKYWLPSATADKVSLLSKIDGFALEISADFKIDISFSLALTKLAILLSSTVKNAQRELTNLKASRAEMKLILTALEKLYFLSNNQIDLTLRDQYFLFLEAKDSFVILTLLCLAFNIYSSQIKTLLVRYFDPSDPLAHPKPLITGKTLLENLDIRPGPIIGKLLTEIQIAYLEGKIQTKAEALNFAKERKLLENN
jgi:tRNA nucleotidyltransferase (CCA-adding enzyme)